MDQCSVLYIKPGPREETHVKALRALGFSVDVAGDIPPAEQFTPYHAVLVRVADNCNLPSLGTRLRTPA